MRCDGNCAEAASKASQALHGLALRSRQRRPYDIDVRYFGGLAGATRCSSTTPARSDSLSRAKPNISTQRPSARLPAISFDSEILRATRSNSSQTHVVWTAGARVITVLGPDFYRFRLEGPRAPERLGPHGVTSSRDQTLPSRRYLCYGAMDARRLKRVRERRSVVFDLETGASRGGELPATAVAPRVHPTEDRFYAPTAALCASGEFGVHRVHDLAPQELSVRDRWPERLGKRAICSISKDLPGSLTSDVVVTRDHVTYNACASGQSFRPAPGHTCPTFASWTSGPSLFQTVKHWRTVAQQCDRELCAGRNHTPTIRHVLLQRRLRATRWSAIDGKLWTPAQPVRRWLLSAHRGLNEVIVVPLIQN